MPKEPELETPESDKPEPDQDTLDEASDERGSDSADERAKGDGSPRRDADDDADREAERARKRKSKASRAEPRGSAAKRRALRQSKRKRPPPPETEEEIDAPNRLTLLALGAMAAATLLMWGAARFACNYRGEEPRKPRAVTTQELAREPKDAALEIQQRLATYDFAGALELSKGQLADEIRKDKARLCDADPEDCKRKREQRSSGVMTTAALLAREATTATVRVQTTGVEGAKQSYLVDVEADGKIWKATSRRPDSGRAAEPSPSAAVPTPEPQPRGSAAP